jgi:hypothetical protein
MKERAGTHFMTFLLEVLVIVFSFCLKKRRACQMKHQIWANTNAMELNTFFGILLLAGAEKRSDATIRNIFFYKMSTFSINDAILEKLAKELVISYMTQRAANLLSVSSSLVIPETV